eukprot:Sdes_comp19672_c0_seq3m11534
MHANSFASGRLQDWESQQNEWRTRVVFKNKHSWKNISRKQTPPETALVESGLKESSLTIRYIAGLDISYNSHNLAAAHIGVACLVIVEFEPPHRLLYADYEVFSSETEYMCGYLAFREAPPYFRLLARLRKDAPCFVPDVILVDGNGVLHPREYGIACHVGIVTEIPTIGVAKSLHYWDTLNITPSALKSRVLQELTRVGSSFELVCSCSKKVLGCALKNASNSTKPIFVSVGNYLDLETAMFIVRHVSIYRIPGKFILFEV